MDSPTKIYIHQLCVDTVCHVEDHQKQWLVEMMDGMREPKESVLLVCLDDDLYFVIKTNILSVKKTKTKELFMNVLAILLKIRV